MSDSIISQSKYNIISFNELTLEEHNDTIEIYLCRKSVLFRREKYYMKYKKVKANIEKEIELYEFCADNPLPKYLVNFEDTCFYWYLQSMKDYNLSVGNELPFIHERDFHGGAYIDNHTFNHKDNSFTFQIRYNGNSHEYFADKIQTIIKKKLTKNELMDCFWLVTNNTITINKYIRDANGDINGSIEMYRLNDKKSFFSIVSYGLGMYLYRLSKLH